MKRVLIISLLALSCGPVRAEEAAQNYDKWWTKSSMSYSPLPQKWFIHTEAVFSYQGYRGNSSGTVYDGTGKIVVRKHRFSNYLSYQEGKQDIRYPLQVNRVQLKRQILDETFYFDIDKHLFILLGLTDTKDDAVFIRDRNTYYLGPGLNYTFGENVRTRVYAAYGREDTTYVTIAPGLTRSKSDGVYYYANLFWQITPDVSLAQAYTYLDYANKNMGELKIYDAACDIKIMKHLFLNLAYTNKFENNPVVRVIPGAFKRDENHRLGLKFSY